MKINVLTNNLQGKLSYVNHAVSLKSQLPILLNILIETSKNGIKLSSTDLEIGIETFLPATVIEEGGITVPAKTFTELISSLSEDSLTLQTTDNTLEVISKKTKSVFQITPKDDFPNLYEEQGEQIAVLQESSIHKDLSSVIFAASNDTTRPALSGVLVRKEKDGFLLVATDGYRLSLKHYKSENTSGTIESFIVPARVFRELLAIKEKDKDIEMYIAQGSNQVLFIHGDTVLVGRLIEAKFPGFEKLIPSDFSVSVSFDREELLKAIKICSIFARDAANIVKLSFQSDKIVVSSQSQSVGENTVNVDAKLKGEENEIAFNARYLLDVLSNIEEKDLVFEMTGPLNPGIFKIQGDNSFLHLIMPIRVQG